MATTMRDVIIDLRLEPVYWDQLPEIAIEFNGQRLFHGNLSKMTDFN